jgi:hypothetical protein
MKKKIFTLVLLAVFVLTQFSLASATAEPGAVTALEPLPTFHNAGDITLDWSVTGMDGTGTQNLFLWARSSISLYSNWDDAVNFCWGPINLNTLTNANGTYVFHTDDSADDDQDVVEFITIVSDQADCFNASADVSASDPAQASTFIDAFGVASWPFNYPSLLNNPYFYDTASCNTFEMWAIGSDSLVPKYNTGPEAGYSGIKAWNPTTTGTFAPPAPQGSEDELFSWVFTFPPTASGEWTFHVLPEDYAGSLPTSIPYNGYWRYGPLVPDVTAAELEECANFSDVSGDDNEVYIRYLADLGLISGFADGTFGPDNTLTRAEAATLFEISYGYDETSLPPTAPTGCEFTDVSASDWFAGWVWQACADGFMNGVGGGLFDPNNLLTRGQVVTIFNNIHNIVPSVTTYSLGNYLETASVLYYAWGEPAPYPVRSSAWSDVNIGDYFAEGVVQAYGWGVADGTSESTFSPNAPITRGLFAKWLYRALSRAY